MESQRYKMKTSNPYEIMTFIENCTGVKGCCIYNIHERELYSLNPRFEFRYDPIHSVLEIKYK